MRTVHSKRTLPRCWRNHPACKHLVLEQDIAVSPRSRLRAKLLVFDGVRHMRRFIKTALGWNGAKAGAFCQKLSVDVLTVHKDGRETKLTKRDPRYFAIIVLAKNRLFLEYVVHEANHAAFEYADRVNRMGRWPDDIDNSEERVCYPTGRIVCAINHALQDANLWK